MESFMRVRPLLLSGSPSTNCLTKAFYVSVVLYRASLVAVKICFLLHYLRLFPLGNVRKLCFILLAITAIWGILQLLLVIFQCRPVSGFWDKTIDSACLPMPPQWYIHAAGNIATDIAIFALPLPVLNTLALPFHEKLLVLGVFSLGFL
jgi:hypothetical protein